MSTWIYWFPARHEIEDYSGRELAGVDKSASPRSVAVMAVELEKPNMSFSYGQEESIAVKKKGSSEEYEFEIMVTVEVV